MPLARHVSVITGITQQFRDRGVALIDVKSGRIVNSTTVEGTSGSAGVGLVFTRSALPIGLGGWSKTPMEKALRQCIEGHDWKSLGLRVPVTISFGIAQSRADVSTNALIREADLRLYQAKNGGRNLVVAF